MKIYILTLFPDMLKPVLSSGILEKAQNRGVLGIRLVDIRDFSEDSHSSVDDYPYGGGPGMVIKPEPVYGAIEWVQKDLGRKPYVVLLTPQGRRFDAKVAAEMARREDICLVAGRYEGFDERIRASACDEVSIGDFVLQGGELPALVIVEAISRFVPGVLGSASSAYDDSHSSGLLEFPQYTRPPTFRGMEVPQVLLHGDHAAVAKWRRREAIRRTLERRPDLLAQASLTFEDRVLLEEILAEQGAGLEDGCATSAKE